MNHRRSAPRVFFFMKTKYLSMLGTNSISKPPPYIACGDVLLPSIIYLQKPNGRLRAIRIPKKTTSESACVDSDIFPCKMDVTFGTRAGGISHARTHGRKCSIPDLPKSKTCMQKELP